MKVMPPYFKVIKLDDAKGVVPLQDSHWELTGDDTILLVDSPAVVYVYGKGRTVQLRNGPLDDLTVVNQSLKKMPTVPTEVIAEQPAEALVPPSAPTSTQRTGSGCMKPYNPRLF